MISKMLLIMYLMISIMPALDVIVMDADSVSAESLQSNQDIYSKDAVISVLPFKADVTIHNQFQMPGCRK